MQTITIEATLDENHELHLTLPDLPPGRVELIVRPLPDVIADERDAFKNALREAGLLAEDMQFDEAIDVSDDELERLRQVFSGSRPLSEIIIEDREDRV